MVPREKYKKLSIKKEGTLMSKKMAVERLLRDEASKIPNENGSDSRACPPRQLDG